MNARRGQALAETLIAALALVALLLCAPLIGKLWDMGHASLAASRYGAWERTAWFAPGSGLAGVASKPDTAVRDEIAERVVLGPRGQTTWRDHRGTPLVSLTEYAESEQPTPPGGFYRLLGSACSTLSRAIPGGSSVGPCDRLPPTPDGYFPADVDLVLDDASYLGDIWTEMEQDHGVARPPGGLEVASQAALLTRDWSANGDELTWERTRPLVASTPLGNRFTALFSPLARVFAWFFPEFRGTHQCLGRQGPPGPRGGLCPGFIDPAPVPGDREGG